jgi:hypothetical protein
MEVRLHRRKFLKDLGTVTVVVAAAQVWRVLGQETPEVPNGAAFEPWREWRADMQEGPLALVHAAILSSNAFNSQPWLFRASSSRIEIYADTKRNLGAFDPYLREMFFSLGCALENLLLAAKANHLRGKVTLPVGKLAPAESAPERHLAVRVDLSPGVGGANELFSAIPHRHTNRTLFDAQRELSADFLNSMRHLVDSEDRDVKLCVFTAEVQRRRIVDLIWDASRNLMADEKVRRGTQPWYRTTVQQLEQLKDGAYVGSPDPASYVDMMSSGRLFGLIAVRDRYDRPQTIRAGRVWQRAHLLATTRGVAARPANGAVEMIDHERQLNLPPKTMERLAGITGDSSWQPTFMFYMGLASAAAPASVRRPVQDVVIA